MNRTRKYDDILHLPRPVSAKRAHMPVADRAAQFSPFAALTGYEDVIGETGRLTDLPIELAEGANAMLDEAMAKVIEEIHNQPEAEITYFLPDTKKLGGAYVTVRGNVKKVDTYQQLLVLTDGMAIPLNQIISMEINP